jgi:general secretion pathway protein K
VIRETEKIKEPVPAIRIRVKKRQESQAGVALMVVMTIIVILTTLAMDFSFNAKVSLNLAANSRDEVKAYFLAKSAFNISRLILFYQRQVDQTLSKMAIPGLGNSIQLWKLIPIESDFTKSFAKGDLFSTMGIPLSAPTPVPGEQPPPKQGLSADSKSTRAFESEGSAKTEFGDFDGYFRAEITDEEGKISIKNFDQLSGLRNLSMTELLTLILPSKYNYLFENRDMDNQYTSRMELVGALKDYMDADDKMFDLVTGTDSGPPEDSFYQKLEEPYLAKNAPYDTLEELRMVRGVGDDFFALFADRLTIYPVTKLNINSADDNMISAFICGFVKERNHPFCTDTSGMTQRTVLERFRAYKLLKAGTNMFYTPNLQDIREFFASEGIVLNDSMLGLGKIEDAITSTSSFFTIRSIGKAGNVTKNITAVVFTGDGKSDILYWRED